MKLDYGNGLSRRNQGQSPLNRNFVLSLKGDFGNDIYQNDSFSNQKTN